MIKLKRCSTGEILEFSLRGDADWYSGNPDYEEVHDEVQAEETAQAVHTKAVEKRRPGRPRKDRK